MARWRRDVDALFVDWWAVVRLLDGSRKLARTDGTSGEKAALAVEAMNSIDCEGKMTSLVANGVCAAKVSRAMSNGLKRVGSILVMTLFMGCHSAPVDGSKMGASVTSSEGGEVRGSRDVSKVVRRAGSIHDSRFSSGCKLRLMEASKLEACSMEAASPIKKGPMAEESKVERLHRRRAAPRSWRGRSFPCL